MFRYTRCVVALLDKEMPPPTKKTNRTTKKKQRGFWKIHPSYYPQSLVGRYDMVSDRYCFHLGYNIHLGLSKNLAKIGPQRVKICTKKWILKKKIHTQNEIHDTNKKYTCLNKCVFIYLILALHLLNISKLPTTETRGLGVGTTQAAAISNGTHTNTHNQYMKRMRHTNANNSQRKIHLRCERRR